MTMNRNTQTLEGIEATTKNYRAARDLLGGRVRQLQDELEAAKRRAEPLIRAALQSAKAAEQELSAAIASSPGLFRKPRTQVFHGVKVGIEKGKGALVIADQEQTLKLIRKHLDDQYELLVKTTLKPVKSAIGQLTAADLKRIGVELCETGDQVVIRPVDSELDKMLDALLKTDAAEVDEQD